MALLVVQATLKATRYKDKTETKRINCVSVNTIYGSKEFLSGIQSVHYLISLAMIGTLADYNAVMKHVTLQKMYFLIYFFPTVLRVVFFHLKVFGHLQQRHFKS